LLVTHITPKVQTEVPSKEEEGKDGVQTNFEIPEYDAEALSNTTPLNNIEDDDGKVEEEAESMLRLMQEIQHMREAGQALTDEERRKKAEDMIIKLSQYM
jgi:hypothetical protein